MTSFKYTLFGALFLLASCGEQTELEQPTISNGETVEVTQEISINVLPIQSVGSPATRSAANNKPEKGEAIGITYTDDAVTRVQEGSTPMTEEIKNAYIVQFNGTAPTSTIAWVSGDIKSQLSGGSAIPCTFTMTAGVKNRVYVVANVASAPTKGTTLANFEKPVAFAPSASLPGTGLPMSSMQDVGVGDVFDVFQLRSLLAKLQFTAKDHSGTTIAATNVKLKGVPNGYSFFTQTPGDDAVRPTGTTYSNSGFTLTSGTTYYVPENLSGRNDFLINHYTRALGMAAANAMYVEITNSGTTYNILLGDGSAQDFNFVGGYAYNINATIYGKDELDLRVGDNKIVDLSAGGETANCYIADKANFWYMFDCTVMGNGAVTPVPVDLMSGTVASAIVPSKLNPASAEVLWETQNTSAAPAKGAIVNNNVYLLRGRILFKSGSTVGNAVIAARDGSDNIIWSWHIWRINDAPSGIALKDITDDAGFSVTGLKLMDRNLGALEKTESATVASIGLYYQWGRKDPFPGAATLSSTGTNFAAVVSNRGIDFVTDKSTSEVSVAASVASPTTFYNTGSGDWCITRNDNLWGTALTGTVTINTKQYSKNSGSKSIYDPCPVGWRVAPAYAFANAAVPVASFAQGYDFAGKLTASAKLFMTASGSRVSNGGTLGNVGAYGANWTSAPHATDTNYGNILDFISIGVGPTGNRGRANGYSCRCAKE